MPDDNSGDAEQPELIRFLRSQELDPSETYILREAVDVARVDKLVRFTKDGLRGPPACGPAQIRLSAS
jgi:hypothetical protein